MAKKIYNILSEINLTKSPNSNFPYLNRENLKDRLDQDSSDLPLSAVKTSWDVNEDHMTRTYQINSRSHFSYFLSSLLDHSAEVGHDPVLTVKYPKINVKLKTDSVDEVTELDIEYSKFIDEIFEDILYLQREF